MAKLYFTPTSCGAASFIAAKVGGVKFNESNVVSLSDHKLVKNGKDFYSVNPKGNVPAIELDDGTIINENTGSLYWIAKQSNNLLGTSITEEFEVMNALGYLASEVHPAFGPLFAVGKDEKKKIKLVEALFNKLEYVEKTYLSNGNKYLVGDTFTIADCYLYAMLYWPQYLGVDISKFSKLLSYRTRISQLEKVKQSHAEMNQLESKQKQEGIKRSMKPKIQESSPQTAKDVPSPGRTQKHKHKHNFKFMKSKPFSKFKQSIKSIFV